MSDNGNGFVPPCVGLRVRGLAKAFGPVRAVDGVDLEVRAGGTCALLGPSGCGKTTTLRTIAGLERPDAGEIIVGGRSVSGKRLVHELSGGQQQRVALARALAPTPSLVLLDEPFSNLDASLRDRLRQEVSEILRTAGVTAVFVTHDQEEAMSIAEQVAVMRAGRV